MGSGEVLLPLASPPPTRLNTNRHLWLCCVLLKPPFPSEHITSLLLLFQLGTPRSATVSPLHTYSPILPLIASLRKMAMTMTQRMPEFEFDRAVVTAASSSLSSAKRKRASAASTSSVVAVVATEMKLSNSSVHQHQQQGLLKRARLSPSSSRSSSPPPTSTTRSPPASPPPSPTPSTSDLSLSPPPTPVLAHRSLPAPIASTSSYHQPQPQPSSSYSSALPHRTLRPSRYQHFTSPLCPSPPPLHHPYLSTAKRSSTPHRPTSPPHHSQHHHSKYSSLLHWTLQRNHCLSVRQRHFLPVLQTQSTTTPQCTLQIYPYVPSTNGSSPTSPTDDDSDEDDSDDEAWDDSDDGWDEGETDWNILVVPSQHHQHATISPDMKIPRALTPPNSRNTSPEESVMEVDVEEGEPIVIKEGVTTILLG